MPVIIDNVLTELPAYSDHWEAPPVYQDLHDDLSDETGYDVLGVATGESLDVHQVEIHGTLPGHDEPQSAARPAKRRRHMGCTCVETLSDSASTTDSNDTMNTSIPSVSTDLAAQTAAKRSCQLSDCALTGILAAVGLVGIALPVALGVYALLLVEPAPVIDKSIESFAIPNHQASKRYDAFEKASKEMRGYMAGFGFGKRKKREVDEYSPSVIGSTLVEPVVTNEHVMQEMFGDGLSIHSRQRRQAYEEGFLIPGRTQSIRKWKLKLVYMVLNDDDDDANIFSKEYLEDIHKIETKIQEHPNYKDFCLIDYNLWRKNPHYDKYGGCAPMNTLLTYFYPTVIGNPKDGVVHFDSYGSSIYSNINETLSLAMSHPSFFWYVDDKITKANKKSKILRSEVYFGAPLPGYKNVYGSLDEQTEKLTKFMATYIDLLDNASTSRVKVLYGGTVLYDYMVNNIFWNDLMLTAFSGVSIVIFMYILTAFSVWLTIMGMMAITLSFPLALFFYRIVFARELLGILNGVATFVVIGIGVDDVFVFINTFRQTDCQMSLRSRLLVTIQIAGRATLFTSATTAAAFAANVASSIPAVHDFGLFMSIIVISCWLMVLWLIPPALAIWQMAFAACESCCYRSCQKCKGVKNFELPPELSALDNSKGKMKSAPSPEGYRDTVTEWVQDSWGFDNHGDDQKWSHDADVSHDAGWMTYLGTLNAMVQKNSTSSEGLIKYPESPDHKRLQSSSRGCELIKRIQIVTFKYIARPVYRGRWVVLGMYLVLLLVAAGLTSQLKLATKPPQLFRSDTSLQQLIDLRANFSSEDITCDRCSGLYVTGTLYLNSSRTEKPRDITPSPHMVDKPVTVAPPGSTPRPPTSRTTVTRTNPTTTTKTSTKTAASTKATTPGPASPSPSPPISTPSPTVSPTTAPTSVQTQTPSATLAVPPTSTAGPQPSSTPAVVIPASTTGSSTIKLQTQPTESPTPIPSSTQPSTSAPKIDLCTDGRCKEVEERPNLESRASVFVVFGIKDLLRGNSSASVFSDSEDEKVILDETFSEAYSMESLLRNITPLAELCQVCKLIANSTEYVLPNGAQCLPEYIVLGNSISNALDVPSLLQSIPECRDIPTNQRYIGRYLPARSMAGFILPSDKSGLKPGFRWIAFAFASTTFKGQSYFTAYEDYQKWESLMKKIKEDVLRPDSPLQSMYQTSEFWPQVMMEVVAVNSAIYGLMFSLLICVSLVTIFTGHVLLLLIIVLTILGVVIMVVAIFYIAGWEMGAVEAVSLSVLVGSSVDYCAHLVEGYLQAGHSVPLTVGQNAGKARRWRTQSAVGHIGVSIISSALTTIISAIPLTQTVIIPFSKFGQIVAINTTVSIVYTLTACTAFLSLFGPALYKRTLRSVGIASGATVGVIATLVLVLYGMSQYGFHIPGPNGEDLFPVPS